MVVVLRLDSSGAKVGAGPCVGLKGMGGSFFVGSVSLRVGSVGPVAVYASVLGVGVRVVIFVRVLILGS